MLQAQKVPNESQASTSNIDIPYNYSLNQKMFEPSINNSSYEFAPNSFSTHNNTAHYPKHLQTTTSNTDKNTTLPFQTPSTLSLATFACDIEKEITNKVLKKLKLNQNNHNNILMVTMCN